MNKERRITFGKGIPLEMTFHSLVIDENEEQVIRFVTDHGIIHQFNPDRTVISIINSTRLEVSHTLKELRKKYRITLIIPTNWYIAWDFERAKKSMVLSEKNYYINILDFGIFKIPKFLEKSVEKILIVKDNFVGVIPNNEEFLTIWKLSDYSNDYMEIFHNERIWYAADIIEKYKEYLEKVNVKNIEDWEPRIK